MPLSSPTLYAWRARTGAGADDQLVSRQARDDLVEDREHRDAPAVDHALATDLDDLRVGQDPKRRAARSCGRAVPGR